MGCDESSGAFFCCDTGCECKYATQLRELQQQISQLKSLVRTDELTKLYNFRFFSEAVPLEMERSRRNLQPLSLILLDVDHFKEFNDRWGHEAGNIALVKVAEVIGNVSRKLDYPCRYGGEEFALILPNTNLAQAVMVAERLREALSAARFAIGSETLGITASLGVGEFDRHGSETTEDFIVKVDKLLYSAKKAGRNQIAHPPAIFKLLVDTQVSDEEKQILFAQKPE